MNAPGQPIQYRAILIGSPDFSACGLPSPSSLRASARGIRNYLQAVLGLEEKYELLSLFGWDDAPGDQLKAITDFLKRVKEEVAENEDLVLLVYYLGHGYIAKTSNAYCLAIKSTTPEFSLADGIVCKELLSRLKAGAPQRKRILFIDACFAAKAAGDAITLSENESLVLSELAEVPDPWTAVYCAVKSDTLALAPKGSKYTLFSHGVIHALNSGDGASKSISIEVLDELAWGEIQKRFQGELLEIPKPHLYFPDQPKVKKADPVFPIASHAVNEDVLRAVKLILANELSDLADTLREAIRPELEDVILTSVDQKIAHLRTERKEELNSVAGLNATTVMSLRRELLDTISDRVRVEVGRRVSGSLKRETRPFGDGIISTLASLIASNPEKNSTISTKGRGPGDDLVKIGQASDRGSRMYGLFFSRLYDGHGLIESDGLLYKQNLGFVVVLAMFVLSTITVMVKFNSGNAWPILLSVWLDNSSRVQISQERIALVVSILTVAISALFQVFLWGIVGLFGHRLTTTHKRYHSYRFLNIPINPNATTAIFGLAIVVCFISTAIAGLVMFRFTALTP
jgi:hypothetical protein